MLLSRNLTEAQKNCLVHDRNITKRQITCKHRMTSRVATAIIGTMVQHHIMHPMTIKEQIITITRITDSHNIAPAPRVIATTNLTIANITDLQIAK